jgi:hypothetical protein
MLDGPHSTAADVLVAISATPPELILCMNYQNFV